MFLWLKKDKEEKINVSIKYALLSETYKKKFQYKKAISLMNKAICLDKKNDVFYYQQSALFFMIEDYKKALKHIETAIKLNNKIYYYYLLNADIVCMLQDNKTESNCHQKAIELKQNAFLHYEKQIEIYEKEQNRDLINFYRKQLEKINSFR